MAKISRKLLLPKVFNGYDKVQYLHERDFEFGLKKILAKNSTNVTFHRVHYQMERGIIFLLIEQNKALHRSLPR